MSEKAFDMLMTQASNTCNCLPKLLPRLTHISAIFDNAVALQHHERPLHSMYAHGFQYLVDNSHGPRRHNCLNLKNLSCHPRQENVAPCLLQLLARIDETLK